MINNNDNIDKIAFAFFSSLVICSILNDSYLIINDFFKNSYIKKKISYLSKIYKIIIGLSMNNYKKDDDGNIILDTDEIKSTNPFDYNSDDLNDIELLKKEINELNNQVLEDLNEELENDDKIKLCIKRKDIIEDENNIDKNDTKYNNCSNYLRNNDDNEDEDTNLENYKDNEVEDNEVEDNEVEDNEVEDNEVENNEEENNEEENNEVEDNEVEYNKVEYNEVEYNEVENNEEENKDEDTNLENYNDNIIEENNLIQDNHYKNNIIVIEDKKIKKISKKNKPDNKLIKFISNKNYGDLAQDQETKNKKVKKTKKIL